MFKKTILMIGLLCSASSFAIECPEKIKCEIAGDVKSCKSIGGTQEYWSNAADTNSYGGNIEPDTYNFTSADGKWELELAQARCSYSYDNHAGMVKTIEISSIPFANQSPNYDGHKSTNWDVYADNAYCYGDVKKCNFVEKPELLMVSPGQWENRTVKIKGVTAEIRLGVFTKENALTYCDKNSKECSLEVYATQMEMSYTGESALLGVVVVDKDTLKIIKVTKDKANTRFEFKQAKPFNSIEVKRIV